MTVHVQGAAALDHGDFVIPVLRPASRSSSRHSLLSSPKGSPSTSPDLHPDHAFPSVGASPRHSLQMPRPGHLQTPPGISQPASQDFPIPASKAPSSSSSRASLQPPSPLESPSTSLGSQDILAYTGRPARGLASARHSVQLPGQQQHASMSSHLPEEFPDPVARPARSSPKQSLHLAGAAQPKGFSTGEDDPQDFVIPTARPTSSSPANSLQLPQAGPQGAQADSAISRSNSAAEASYKKSSSRKTSFKLDQVLPDPSFHAPTLQPAQLGGIKQKRNTPLIQQPVRPASPSSASKTVQKQSQGFRPQQDWVGFGSRKPHKH